jgi:hypothetical protein
LWDHQYVIEGEGHGYGAFGESGSVNGWFLPHGDEFFSEITGFLADEIEFFKFLDNGVHRILSTYYSTN